MRFRFGAGRGKLSPAARQVGNGAIVRDTEQKRPCGAFAAKRTQSLPHRQRDLLRPKVLLHRHRVVRAALDRGVVGHHDALAAADPADPGDDAGAGHRVLVHALGGQRRDFQEGTIGI